MGKKIVVLGDATSHGGKVVSVSSTFEIEGKNVALLNDSVSCPEHGCKSACGSVIFASLPDVEIG